MASLAGLLFPVAASPAWNRGNFSKLKADRVVILKKERVLKLFLRGKLVREYKIALGRNPVGPKTQDGDGKTPEGVYRIDYRNAQSSYHRALHLSYPSAADVARARRLGVSPGKDIMIHGLPNGMGSVGKLHRMKDWTEGCIAVTDEEIEEIWGAVPNGTLVEIKP